MNNTKKTKNELIKVVMDIEFDIDEERNLGLALSLRQFVPEKAFLLSFSTPRHLSLCLKYVQDLSLVLSTE